MKYLVIAIVAACVVPPQDEANRLIERLGADSIQEREQATRNLERLGQRALEPIERALAVTREAEVRERLAHVARVIRKRVEFAKVFGEATRITVQGKGRPLAEVAGELARALGETLEMEGFDGTEKVTLDLRDATVWEALDELARAGDLHYQYDYRKLLLQKGARPRFPVIYLEQFRVSVVEAKRIEEFRPGMKESVGMIVLEVRHQRNMHPAVVSSDDLFKFTDFSDALGNGAATVRPSGGSAAYLGRPFSMQTVLFVSDKATPPFSVRGMVKIPFASETKDVSLAFVGEDREMHDDSFAVRVKEVRPSPSMTRLSLEAEPLPGSTEDPRARLHLQQVYLVDDQGIKHLGRWTSSSFGRRCTWEFEFDVEIRRPEKVLFRWAQKFHRVEIPFLFEGLALPGR